MSQSPEYSYMYLSDYMAPDSMKKTKLPNNITTWLRGVENSSMTIHFLVQAVQSILIENMFAHMEIKSFEPLAIPLAHQCIWSTVQTQLMMATVVH